MFQLKVRQSRLCQQSKSILEARVPEHSDQLAAHHRQTSRHLKIRHQVVARSRQRGAERVGGCRLESIDALRARTFS